MAIDEGGDRPEGYYWIRFGGNWIIAEYQGGKWWMAGMEAAVETSEIDVVQGSPLQRLDLVPILGKAH